MSEAAPPDEPGRRPFRELPRWSRWTAYVAAVLVLVLVALAAVAVVAVRRPLPQTTGTLRLAGLDGPVTVRRDTHGVPHVYAESAEDLFLAQGYVQAQDRFFQMDVRRHVTAGRLAEMLGRDALEVDKLTRTLGWRRVAERELALLRPATLRHLDAFSQGVNEYIRSHAPSEMSLEYTLLDLGGLDYHVEDWSPADSVSWLKAMAWDLRGNMQEEVERARLSGHIERSRIDELFPPYPFGRHRPVVAAGEVVRGRFSVTAGGAGAAGSSGAAARPAYGVAVQRALSRLQRRLEAMPQLLGRGAGIGSNAWVVAGEHSATGAPILANDPHLAPSLPGVWYQMGLHCTEVRPDCPFDVSGFTFAGLPGVVVGHNADIAWGFTNLGPDVTDLYLERVVGAHRYLRGKRAVRLRERRETIEVAGGEAFSYTVRSTVHGPLISDVSESLSTVGANSPVPADAPERRNGYAVSLAWTALTPNRTMDAVFALDAAADWEDFRAAAALFAAPSQNMVYADRRGHIGYQAPGLIPIRRPGHSGDWPVPGWQRRYDWTGEHVPFEALPAELDPAEGFVATANQAVVGSGYPYDLGDSWAYGYRSQRIVELLREEGTLSVADMSRIQLDTRNGFAPVLVPHLLEVQMGTPYYRAGQRLLRRWDFMQPADSAAAAYFNAVWRNLLARTFHDEMPQVLWPEGDDRWFEVVRRLLRQPNSVWWDDAHTHDVRERRDDILLTAMRDARDELVRLQARRPADWTWGHQHVLRLRNDTLGRSDLGPVRALLNRGRWEVGGGSSIVNATGWHAGVGYAVNWVPSMRMVVSLEDFDDSTWISLTGASGHAFGRHYVDQTDLWVEGRTLPWPFTADAVQKETRDVLSLVPEGG